MTLNDKLSPFLNLCQRGGAEIVPWWLGLEDTGAALTAAGAISGWLAERGVAVAKDYIGGEWKALFSGGWLRLPDAPDHLSALIAAATPLLPDAKGGPA